MPTKLFGRVLLFLWFSVQLITSNAQQRSARLFIQAGSGFIALKGLDERIQGDKYGRIGTIPFFLEGGVTVGLLSISYYYGKDNEKASGTFGNFPKNGKVHIHGFRLSYQLFPDHKRIIPFFALMYSQTNKIEVVPLGYGFGKHLPAFRL